MAHPLRTFSVNSKSASISKQRSVVNLQDLRTMTMPSCFGATSLMLHWIKRYSMKEQKHDKPLSGLSYGFFLLIYFLVRRHVFVNWFCRQIFVSIFLHIFAPSSSSYPTQVLPSSECAQRCVIYTSHRAPGLICS